MLGDRTLLGLRPPSRDAVAQRPKRGEARQLADADAQVRQADDLGVEAVDALEDRGDGGEKEVEQAEDEADVDGHDEHHGGEEEQLPGADEGPGQDLRPREAAVELGDQVLVAGFATEAVGLAGEQDVGVRLAHDDQGQYGYDAAL